MRSLRGAGLARFVLPKASREDKKVRYTSSCTTVLPALVLLAGCAGSPRSTDPLPKRPPPPNAVPLASVEGSDGARDDKTLEEEAGPGLGTTPRAPRSEREMRTHFQDALAVRRAVVAGKPEDASRYAMLLALSPSGPELPAAWIALAQRMQVDARRIARAKSATQAAAATADLAADCGRCHAKLGGPKLASPALPTDESTLESRMRRHQWASERLWEGLAVPSNEAWQRGAQGLGENPFPLEISRADSKAVRDAANDFTALVGSAPTRITTEERVALYAELLVTCGACHRALRVSIR